MPPSTSSCLRQGPTHVTDTGRCPTPCPNPTEVARLGQLSLCCSRSGASPSSRACSVLIPALRLSRAAVCAATELSVRCSQDPSDLRTTSVLRPDRRGEPVVTATYTATDHSVMPQSFSTSTALYVLPDPSSGSVTKMDLRTGALLAKPATGNGGNYDQPSVVATAATARVA